MKRHVVRLSLVALFGLAPALTWAQAAPEAKASAAPATAPAERAPPPAATTKSVKPKAGKASKGAKAAKNPTVVLYHVNRHETMSLRLRDAQGKPVKGLQKKFNRFLRCHYTGNQHAMHPRLVRLLYQTGKKWPGRRIEVVSGYRHPKVAKNPHSPHMKGLACDFRVAGVKTAELRDYLRKSFDKVGVGYYPNSSFVHLDVRKDRSAFWIDYSGPGERAMYSENPQEDLRTGRAEQFKPTRIDESWASDTSEKDEGGTAETATP